MSLFGRPDDAAGESQGAAALLKVLAGDAPGGMKSWLGVRDCVTLGPAMVVREAFGICVRAAGVISDQIQGVRLSLHALQKTIPQTLVPDRSRTCSTV